MPTFAGVFAEVLAGVVGMLLAVGTAISVFDHTGASLVSAGGLSHNFLRSCSLATCWLPLLMEHETGVVPVKKCLWSATALPKGEGPTPPTVAIHARTHLP